MISKRARCAVGAALLACPLAAALAQSNTIYGRVDIGVRYLQDVTNGGQGSWSMSEGSRGRIGFRGSEDLGGGLSAFYQLEHRFFATTGMQDGDRFWKDKSWVGLAKRDLGNIRFGRMSSPVNDRGVNGRFEAFGGDSLAGLGGRGAAQVDKWDNAVSIQTVDIGGFRAAAAYALNDADNRKDNYGAQIEYRTNRLIVSAAWQKDSRAATTSRLADDWQTASLAATYDAGIFALYGIAARSWDIGATDDGRSTTITVGASAPVPRGEVRLSYQVLNQDRMNGVDGSTDVTRRRAGLGYHYPLSKLTAINMSVLHDRYQRGYRDRVSGWGSEVALRVSF